MRRTTTTSQRRLATTACVIAVVWAVAPAAASGSPGQPEHAGDRGRPQHSHESGAPDHAASEEAEPGQERAATATTTDDRAARHATTQRSRAEGDPNRGSVKVRTVGVETRPPRTEPHVGCEFWFHFHGFDAGVVAISLHAWAPTGDGQQVFAGEVELRDARGADLSGIFPTDPDDGLTLDDLDLDPTWPGDHEAHEQQGWHVRLEVEGPKHKMFWIDCPVDVEEVPDVPDEVTDVPEEVADVTEDVTVEAPPDEAFGVGGADLEDDVAVLGVVLEAAAEDDEVAVRGAVEERAELPVTGAHLAWLVAIALLLAAVGGRMVAATRVGARAAVTVSGSPSTDREVPRGRRPARS
jgi:hypothetical protein